MEEFETNAGDKLWVHDAGDCRGPVCPVHKPTPHHMREWKMIWRGDRRIFERLCPEHGVGHPDPDDLEAQELIKGYADGIHGCCLCCARPRVGDYVRGVAYYRGLKEEEGILHRNIVGDPPEHYYYVTDTKGNNHRIKYNTAYRVRASEYTMVDLDPDLR